VPVVAGFQGRGADGDITTIGRGGSDTTAVALAVVLGADECQILTDVDGVYTTDPRMVPEAGACRASVSRKCSNWRGRAHASCTCVRSSSPRATA
jgi:glutamate 5-kinase